MYHSRVNPVALLSLVALSLSVPIHGWAQG